VIKESHADASERRPAWIRPSPHLSSSVRPALTSGSASISILHHSVSFASTRTPRQGPLRAPCMRETHTRCAKHEDTVRRKGEEHAGRAHRTEVRRMGMRVARAVRELAPERRQDAGSLGPLHRRRDASSARASLLPRAPMLAIRLRRSAAFLGSWDAAGDRSG
jgi:hypothetical protein